MNLKIDQSQQGLHNNTIYSASNGNGVPSYNVGVHLGGKQQAHNSQLLQSIYQPIQRPSTLNGSANNSINMVLQQQEPQVSVSQYGVPTSIARSPQPPPPLPPSTTTTTALIQMAQANHHGRHEHCNYPDIIQQPGTPDDDDYRHNYQDITSVNRHLFDTAATSCQNITTTTTSGSATIPPVHTHQTMAQCGKMITTASTGNDSNNYIYQQSTMINSTSGKMIPHRRGQNAIISDNRPQQQQQNNQQQQQQQHQLSDNRNNPSSNNAPSSELANQNNEPHGSYIENPLSNLQENNNMLNLSHMSCSYIDSCASPFQSPTSTPYPLIGSYLTPDIQDYYSDDCLQYSNTQ